MPPCKALGGLQLETVVPLLANREIADIPGQNTAENANSKFLGAKMVVPVERCVQWNQASHWMGNLARVVGSVDRTGGCPYVPTPAAGT